MRESFVFYRSFYEALAELSQAQQTKVVMALCEYALNGKEPDLKGAPAAVFKLIRPQVDANNRKYENGKKGGEHGVKGGRPKKEPQENPSETPQEPQENRKKTRNVNVNVNVNDNDNVNVNENVNGNGNDARARARAVALPSGGVDFFADVEAYEPVDYFAGIK